MVLKCNSKKNQKDIKYGYEMRAVKITYLKQFDSIRHAGGITIMAKEWNYRDGNGREEGSNV